MTKNKKIKDICIEIFLIPILLCLITSSIISAILFLKLAEQNREIEIHRLNDILPLVARPITASLIVGDPRSRRALIDALKIRLKLSFMDISEFDDACINKKHSFWYLPAHLSREICLSGPIRIADSKQYVTIKSTVHKYDFNSLIQWLAWINVPLISLGYINGFFLRKKILRSIADPILKLSSNPEKMVKNKNTALEIINLSNKFNAYIASLKEHQDVIEKTKIKNNSIEIATQVAHDIRSPLAAIRIAVECLKNHSDSDITIIKKSAERINDIANNLLNQFNANKRKESYVKSHNSEPVCNSIEQIIYEKKYEFIKKNITIISNIPARSSDVFSEISTSDLKRILSNIINNSAEAIHSLGLIKINMDYDHSEIKIEVHDNGCGIPKEILSRIRENGFSYKKKNGSGIGLSYTESRVKEAGGKLFINSQPSKGTCVSLHLPRSTSPFLTH